MTELEQACHDLAAWLPRVVVLLSQPDTQATAGHAKPHSTPPWNSAAANALFDALEGTRRIHQAMQREITGRDHPGQPHSRAGRTLRAIPRLAAGLPACPPPVKDDKGRWIPCRCLRCDATRQLTRYTTAFMQLPAIDLEERPQPVRTLACPYCHRMMLRVYVRPPRGGTVTCVAKDACLDGNGRHPVGHMTIGQASGEPFIAWADGLIQLPEGLTA